MSLKGFRMQSLDEVTQLFESQRHMSLLHHAWILEGLDESKVVKWLEEATLRLTGGDFGDNHFHPNVFWLKSEDPHTVESVRMAINFLEKTSWDGGWKVCVIECADRLNSQAQNALLKMMEEPPEHAIIFLVSSKVRTLLPTIYSRGLHLIVSDSDTEDLERFERFSSVWMDAVRDILMHRNYEKICRLQDTINDEGIDFNTQAVWVLQAFKRIIDHYQYEISTVSLIDQVASLKPLNAWLEHWNHGQKYLADAIFFNVDQKQFCVKLTAKILE